MKLRVLGCGTSSGVPRIGNDWGACDPADPRNRRTRASIIVATDTTRILVDTSPDMREQLLAADIDRVDAVIWTHDHADHCHGIDDLRQLFHAKGEPVAGYGARETMDMLAERFAYAFFGRDGYPATIDRQILHGDMMIGDIRVRSVAQPHGNIYSSGLRFDHDGKSIGYSTDFHMVTPGMIALFAGVDIWVVDALRERPHPTHPHLAMTLDAIHACKPARAILTHMDQSLDYRGLAAKLPVGVEPGQDGLEAWA
ncbi:phosphoribosyl 1,2-cyclic phosphate phosphodiesterase [Sphingomonas sp. YR710]|uniref:MBL fold metallo-hydrolase n=1 Tax=Sphingomonas sp. YR710 TaxID=1882773 RepID=UPI0008822A3C|nr:MBL fold metallo-hydrolase [Sphingomonas sp. YR710]SDD50109.1 phosphoribosyl 1,2-cyclic phosphate phosphodiesterase [Sphingomonas sp. YR710]